MATYLIGGSTPRVEAWWDDGSFLETQNPRTITVLDSDDVVETGLLDKDGNAIRKRVKDRIGFLRPTS